MTTARQCNSCGKALPASTGNTTCPSCLLEWGLGESSDEITQLWDPSCPATAPAMTAAPRLTYFGDYELIEEIARGGMGVVYRARQVSLNRIVAVKMILAGHFAGKDAIERFRHEAEAAARLRHPNIVGIHEVGAHEGFQYFSMDYIGGRNLSDAARDGTISPTHAAEWVRTIAGAIHYAHEQGILHRDIKPSNVLIDAANVPHVTDFGLAKQMSVESEITLSGQVIGSPNYMPPEQAQGRRGELSRTADVYSLGAVLFYLLTGRPPFVGQDVGDTLHRVIHDEVTSPRLLNPSTPEDLETICLKCLEKEPGRRYTTALALAEELGRHLRNEPILARKIGAKEKLRRWCRRKPAIAAMAASLVIVFCLGFGGVLWQLHRVNLKSEENRSQVAQLNVLSGVQFMQNGDYFKALLWFAEALRIDAGHAAREEIHRHRIASVLAECPRLVQVITHDGDPISSAAFSPADDRLATIGNDRTLRLWEIPSGKQAAASTPFPSLPYALTFSPDGKAIAVTLVDNTVRVLDGNTAKEILPPLAHKLEGANRSALLPAFDPTGGKLVTQPETNVLQLINVASGSAVGRPMAHPYSIESFQFSGDGSQLFSRIPLPQNFAWDANTGEALPFPVNGPEALGPVSTCSRTNLVLLDGRVWKFPTGRALGSADPHGATASGERLANAEWISAVAFSPDASRIFVAKNDRTGQLFDVATGRALFPPVSFDQSVARATWSPDGRRVLMIFWDHVRVLDADTDQTVTPPIPHTEASRSASFSGSGRYLLTVHPSSSYAAFVWDLERESEPPVLLKPLLGAAVNEQAPRSEMFASREANNLIRIRNMSGEAKALNPLALKNVQQLWWSGDERFVIIEGEMARVQVWDRDSKLPVTPQAQSSYTLEKAKYEAVNLPRLELSVEDTRALAQLLSGAQLDGAGGWMNLDLAGQSELAEESAGLLSLWERLKQARPELFGSHSSDARQWHEKEARAAEGALDWNAAAFHWEKLAALSRKDAIKENPTREIGSATVSVAPVGVSPTGSAAQAISPNRAAPPEQDVFGGTLKTAGGAPTKADERSPMDTSRNFFQQRLVFALANSERALELATNYADIRRIAPLRDPQASAGAIDLSPYTTNQFVDWRSFGGNQIGWRVGWQEFDGLGFDVRLSLNLFGQEMAARGWIRPERIEGIKIRQRAARLHFLHNAGWAGVLTNREELASVVVHYANAATERISLQRDVNVGGDWLAQPFAPEQAKVAWIGPDPFANISQNSLRLVKFTWQNPHPDWEIASLDLVSAKTKADYRLMAVTAEP